MLGGSGCAVSSLGLGTMTFGVETDETVAHAQLDRFVEAGGTLVDTADVYGDGRAEEIIGRWLARRPPDVKDRFVRLGTSDAMAQGYTDMAWAKNEGLDNGVQRTLEDSTPTSFRQWCDEVLKPTVAS